MNSYVASCLQRLKNYEGKCSNNFRFNDDSLFPHIDHIRANP